MSKRSNILFTVLCLAAGLSTPLAPARAETPPAAALPAAIEPTHVVVPGTARRAIDLSVWTAPDARAVVVFSHGYNADAAAYDRILSRWAAAGFTVVAPLHVDSLRHPQHDRYDRQSGFATRIEDLAIARGFVAAAYPGLPLIAAGHSFGSLMSLMEGGAVTAAGPTADPAVKAVVAFSTAGNVPGLVTPGTWAAVDRPLLMITGDNDKVPGFVTDWRDHRAPYDLGAAGGKMLMIFDGADHELVADASAGDFDLIVGATTDFMSAYALNDASARSRLDSLQGRSGLVIERR